MTDSNKLLLVMPRSCLVLYFIYKKRDILHTRTIHPVTFKRLVVSCIATTKIGDAPFRVHCTPPYKKNNVQFFTSIVLYIRTEHVLQIMKMCSFLFSVLCQVLTLLDTASFFDKIWNLFWLFLQYWFIKYLLNKNWLGIK